MPQNPSDTQQDADSAAVAAFKRAFRRHAAGVAIITTTNPDGTPVGFTATSLASLSATPPLATFNLARTASSWPAIAAADRVAIHTLGGRNRQVAQRLSGDHLLRFDGPHWHRGPFGLPIITDATGWMIGRIVHRFPIHDNAVVVVQIEDAGLGQEDDALLYHERGYFTPGDPV